MFKKVAKTKTKGAGGRRIAIVASRYNAKYVNAMLRAAKVELGKAKAIVEVVRVPGGFEIPAVADSPKNNNSINDFCFSSVLRFSIASITFTALLIFSIGLALLEIIGSNTASTSKSE